jgi:cobaltochelatase CobN
MTELKRSRVQRMDGRLMNIVHQRGHLMVCSKGCCCGLTERSFAPVPEDLYHNEWERRKLRNRVHLTQSGCLGPCTLANCRAFAVAGFGGDLPPGANAQP